MTDTLDVERNNAQGSIECPNPWKQRAEAAERICQGNGKIGEALAMLTVVQQRDAARDEIAALRAQLDAVERFAHDYATHHPGCVVARDCRSCTCGLYAGLEALTPKAPTTTPTEEPHV